MLAELLGKLDAEGVGDVDRREDLLTDAVFGSLRHFPTGEVLAKILPAVGVNASPRDLGRAKVTLWSTIPRPDWPGRVIEPDVIILVGRQPIVVEAKLYSEFDHYEPEDGSEKLHQLAVQYHVVRYWAAGERLDPPIVVAVTRGPARPAADLNEALRDAKRLSDSVPHDAIRWLSWRKIAMVLELSQPALRSHVRRLTGDVLAYMEKRGVRRMFTGFQPEDYWLVTAAQRVAAQRLYPEIRTFFEDLGAVLAEDGIKRSQPGWDAVWLGVGTSIAKPVDWTRSFIGRQFWPTAWPTRAPGRLGANLSLYVLFDFMNPGFECGLSIPGPGVAAAQQTWMEQLPMVATGISALGNGFDVVVDVGDVARPTRIRTPPEVDAGWLQGSLASLTNPAHLQLRCRTGALDLTIQSARQLLHDVMKGVERAELVGALRKNTAYLAEPTDLATAIVEPSSLA